MGNIVPALIIQEVVGDTHAADLTGSAGTDTHALAEGTPTDVVSGHNDADVAGNFVGNNLTTTETAFGVITLTPANADNKIVLTGIISAFKVTDAGTVTQRIRRDAGVAGTILVSETTGSISANAKANNVIVEVLDDEALSAQTYQQTIEAETSGIRGITYSVSGIEIAMTGSAGTDTHAADLTGSAGQCQ